MLNHIFHSLPPYGRSSKRRLQAATIASGLAAALTLGSVQADVGLPDYAPLPHEAELAQKVSSLRPPEDHGVARQISAGTRLSCHESRHGEQKDAVLNFALPGDFRSDHQQADTRAQIPLAINGNRAAIQTGKNLSTAKAQLHEGRLLLVGADDSFYNSLQSIHTDDRLLVHTAQRVRQYRVTRARLTHAISHEAQAAEESLSLVACYPFQTVGSQPIFYELRAEPLSASLDAAEGNLAARELVSF